MTNGVHLSIEGEAPQLENPQLTWGKWGSLLGGFSLDAEMNSVRRKWYHSKVFNY